MNFLGEDLEDFEDIPVEDLFHPSQETTDNYETPFEYTCLTGNTLEQEMENYQELSPPMEQSSGPWSPSDSTQTTFKFDGSLETIAKEYLQPSNSFQDLNFSFPSQRTQRLDSVTNIDTSSTNWSQGSHSSPPLIVESLPGTSGVNQKVSKNGKARIKEKLLKSKLASKENNYLAGNERHLVTSKEEERRNRRKESNRRAAEKYRTKLKTSANDVATEHRRLSEENDQLKVKVQLYRLRLQGILDAVARHQQHCSCPLELPAYPFNLDELDSEYYDPDVAQSLANQTPAVGDIYSSELFNGLPVQTTDTSGIHLQSCNAPLVGEPLCQFDSAQRTSDPVTISNPDLHAVTIVSDAAGTQYLSYPSTSTVPVNSFGHLQALSFYIKDENDVAVHVLVSE